MSINNLIQNLKTLGMSDKEAQVYLALLQLGPSTAYSIANKANLKRPTVYVVAEELFKKGYIVKSPHDKQMYVAHPTEIIFEEFENKFNKFKSSLPEFKSLQSGINDKPSVLYFEGVEGIKRALFYKVNEYHGKEVLGFYADPSLVDHALLDITHEYNNYLKKNKIKVKIFTTDSKGLDTLGFIQYFKDINSTFSGKFLSSDIYKSNASLEFYESFIKIIFWDTSVALIIESTPLAKAMRQIFELLWSRIDDKEFRSKFVK